MIGKEHARYRLRIWAVVALQVVTVAITRKVPGKNMEQVILALSALLTGYKGRP